ncbi:hypothetical protein SAMN04489806_2131 [Paramicrobacterium humi]|uniref:Uncharacterized protein n=1 Tax=Paramicrobacterium humi TaxID=640635 RepID=A0A1H4NA91_9MICO|nr:hypothetical protein [Microbacterium humi]SEB92169.1 hypothetical protein SAMN04489806_2131 [Microbacterium humi]
MLVLPVANDGSFAPVTPLSSTVGATQNQLGVRLWSCANLTASAGNLKVTAWRGDYASNAFSWTTAPTLGSFASARLAATSTKALDAATTAATDPGSELRDLHRSQDLLGGVVDGTDPVTGRYSWLLSTGRSKTATTADPACAAAACSLTPGAGITGFANVFSSDMSAAASGGVSGNSVTYLAKKYYEYGTRTVKVCQERSGIWPFFGDWTDTDACGTNGLFKQYRQVDREFTGSAVPVPASGKPAAQATTLSPAAGASVDGLLRDKTGTKLQWVVLEWWGSQAPTDLEIEVFVAP